MKTKKCSKCGVEKCRGEFSPDKRKKDGLYGRCKECRREDFRGKYHEDVEIGRKKSRREYKENPGYVKEWAHKNRFQVALYKSKHHAKKYGHAMCSATVSELEAAFTSKCDVCGVPEAELTKKLCVDHCHETGFFRGFLCHKCNKALGLLGDSEAVLINALHYLMQEHDQEQQQK